MATKLLFQHSISFMCWCVSEIQSQGLKAGLKKLLLETFCSNNALQCRAAEVLLSRETQREEEKLRNVKACE